MALCDSKKGWRAVVEIGIQIIHGIDLSTDNAWLLEESMVLIEDSYFLSHISMNKTE